MLKPEWEQKLPAGYRMATEADRGTPIGRDWKAWMAEWEPIRPNVVGTPLDPWIGNGGSHVPMCIPVAPESKDSMDQYHEDAMQNATTAPVEVPPGTVLESGYRLLHRGDMVMGGDERLVKGKWKKVPPREIGWRIEKVRGVRRRKAPEGHFQDLQDYASKSPLDKEQLERASKELGYAGPDVSLEDMESDCPVYNSTMTHVTIPVTHAWHPKPFTPNKYTRYMPTLDGRKVPVDVYCVLAAFPTGSAAVDHAVKKQLAPGQRGHKDRVQDLKEARASLTRAIELEEAVEG